MVNSWVSTGNMIYSYGNRVKALFKLEYKIHSAPAIISSTYLGYSFVEANSPTKHIRMIGKVAPATQEITNHFPRWMTMRIDPSSVGHKLITSVGQHLEYILDNIHKMRNESFIGTADKTQTHRLYKISTKAIGHALERSTELQKNSFINLLDNSAITLPSPSRFNKAWKWQGNYGLSNTGLFGSHSIKFSGSGKAYQEVDLTHRYISNVNYIIFSGWHKTDSSVSVLNKYTYSAMLHIIYDDETHEISRIALDANTNNTWRKFVLKIKPLKTVIWATVQLCLNTNTDISTSYFDCLQLETGSSDTKWRPRSTDSPWFINSPQIPILNITKDKHTELKRSIWISSSEHEFTEELPPTRVVLESTRKNISATPTASWSRMVDHNGDVWPTKWVIKDGKIKLENLLVGNEIFFEYDIAEYDRTARRFRVYTDVTRTMLALTVHKNKLYVLAKENFNGADYFVIKILSPYVSTYNKTYLQMYNDFNVDIGPFVADISPFDTFPTGQYQMAIADADDSLLIIRTPSSETLVFRMYYDYGYLDSRRAIMYLRENYSSEGCKIVAI